MRICSGGKHCKVDLWQAVVSISDGGYAMVANLIPYAGLVAVLPQIHMHNPAHGLKRL
jgi:hypothetical protein